MIALTIVAALIALGCAAACTRRLYYATNPIAFHPSIWLARIKAGEGDAAAIAVRRTPEAVWERELLDAVGETNPDLRAGRVHEQLTELDFMLGRWARVPRVCASVASSAGFLCGSLVLRYGLVAASNSVEELRREEINACVMAAVNVAALGVAGTVFSIASQARARTASKAFQRAADALVQTLEEVPRGEILRGPELLK